MTSSREIEFGVQSISPMGFSLIELNAAYNFRVSLSFSNNDERGIKKLKIAGYLLPVCAFLYQVLPRSSPNNSLPLVATETSFAYLHHHTLLRDDSQRWFTICHAKLDKDTPRVL